MTSFIGVLSGPCLKETYFLAELMGVKFRVAWALSSLMRFFFMALSTIYIESNVLSSGVASFSNLEHKNVIQKHARRKLDDIAGAINIDCGIPEGCRYNDANTEIEYISDGTFINTGVNRNISSNFSSDVLPKSFMNVRSFPQGSRNCYTLRPPEGKDSIYLIRASFMYGNYDNQDMLPQFTLYVGVNMWDPVKFDNASHIVIKEIIHVPLMDNIYVCLVNTGSGTPFISTLELRHFHNSSYRIESGALVLHQRLDFGSTSNQIIRYHDDINDRIWFPYNCPNCATFNTSFPIDSLNGTAFNLPSKVMRTAARPMNANDSLDFVFDIGDPTLKFYIYMHLAELEILPENQKRKLSISLNGNLLKESVVLSYLQSMTITSPQSVRGSKLSFSLFKSQNCTLPPMLNAVEIYIVRDFLQAPTDQDDVNAIEDIKSSYGVQKDWQGDPCAPMYYAWDGLSCSYNGYNPPRINSLNLSSSGITGQISPSFSNLKLLHNLDLSNNGLTGTLPEFLSQLVNLRTLNLEGNKLSGPVPGTLMERHNKGLLSLRVARNPDLCVMADQCKEKKRSIAVPLVATIVLLAVIIIGLVSLWMYRRRKASKLLVNSQTQEVSSLKSDNRQFTYVEIVKITNNFRTIIGKGGFGTVYHGELTDGMQVAVKMLSPTSTQGSNQFRVEAQLLMRVHHKNLASFIGYCNEGTNLGIIYEYMAYGNLEQYLSDKTKEALSWKERLHIALDVAQGLEYLHHGCKPPIIHRDVKTANILLNEKLQAKIADFGFSKLFPTGSRSHLSTAVVGTVGYLDPEYYISNRLTEKSDVYSFGIVLLELITGQYAIIRNHDENIHLVQWISPFLARGDIRNVVAPRLQENLDTNSLWKFMEIAMSCVPSISIQRPTMNNIVMELKECLEAEIAREQTQGSADAQRMRSSNSFEMISADIETETGPEAR